MGDPGCQLLFGETAGTALRKGADLWRMPGRNYRFAYALADGTRVEFHGIDTNGCQGHVRRDHPEQEHVLYQQVALLHERLQASPSAADFGWAKAPAAPAPAPAPEPAPEPERDESFWRDNGPGAGDVSNVMAFNIQNPSGTLATQLSVRGVLADQPDTKAGQELMVLAITDQLMSIGFDPSKVNEQPILSETNPVV